MKDLGISVVIPAFNERDAIGPLVKEIQDVLAAAVKASEVIVVDDGSTDGTGDEARRFKAKVVAHPVNRGYGRALMTGIAAARHDFVLTIDADQSYPPSQIPLLLEFIPDFDLVIGARTGAFFWGSPFQALLRWIYLRLASFVVGEPIPDANSGLRVVRRSLALEPGPVECLGYSYSTTMTLSLLKRGHFVKYVPIEFRARAGKSKVQKVRDILRTLQIMTQVMIAYNPLKLFVAVSVLPALTGLAFIAAALKTGRWLWGLPALPCAGATLACFLAGCLLDSLRMFGRPGAKPSAGAA